jgi:hypothetical protein
MTEVRNIGAGVFVGGDSGGPPPAPGVESFNGRTGAVVSESGDYLAAVRFSAAAEVASFAAIAGVVHVIDSASTTDPPFTMTLPAAPADKAVVGWVFNEPTGPFPPDAGLNVDPNGNTIASNPGVFFFPTRWPSGVLLLVWSAVGNTWEIENWTDFILSQGSGSAPQVMVRRSDALGRLLFPLTLNQDSFVARPGTGDVQSFQVGAPSVVANFAAKAYTSQDGLGGYSREAFAEQLNTLLPMFPGVPIAGDTTLLVNRTYRVAPPAGTMVTLTMPGPAGLEGGEQVAVLRQNLSSGAFRFDAGNAGFTVPGLGILSAPPNTLYAPSPDATVVVFQYDEQSGMWDAFTSSYVADEVNESFVVVDIPAGATVDVPGPAAGFIRVFDNIILFTTGGGTMFAIPIFLVDALAATWQLQGGTPSTQIINYQVITPLGEGEVIRLGANGGADARAVATYRDYRADNVTLVRATLAAAPAVAIPEPPAGFFSRWYRRRITTNATYFDLCGARVVNRDTVAASVRWTRGATLVGRGNVANATQSSPFNPVAQMPIVAGGGALSVELGAAPTTTAPILVGAYETLPLTTT